MYCTLLYCIVLYLYLDDGNFSRLKISDSFVFGHYFLSVGFVQPLFLQVINVCFREKSFASIPEDSLFRSGILSGKYETNRLREDWKWNFERLL